ncbi:hypothetical protein HDU76_003564 [Blyttiomyces sp. JEL0837]|nr:hypothetical protein HDU76_003564 [Blyttiomyces sp. JEL0837]
MMADDEDRQRLEDSYLETLNHAINEYKKVRVLINEGQLREAATSLLEMFIVTKYDHLNRPPEVNENQLFRFRFRYQCMVEYQDIITNNKVDPTSFDHQSLNVIANDETEHPALRTQAAFVNGVLSTNIGDQELAFKSWQTFNEQSEQVLEYNHNFVPSLATGLFALGFVNLVMDLGKRFKTIMEVTVLNVDTKDSNE